MNKKLYRLDIYLNQTDSEIAQALIFQHIQYGWEEENIGADKLLIRLHCELKNTLEDVKEMIIGLYPYAEFAESEVENKDWTEAWKKYFTLVSAGKFLVLPSWELDTPVDADTIPLYIEPKSAFGTGHHATTALCLHAITNLYKNDAFKPDFRFLDLGCGTGILGLACFKLGMTGLCSDIDPVAIVNTEENLLLNKTGNGIDLATGSIEQSKEDYDIVIANILAGPLKVLAPDIIARVKKDGYLILSGILSSQADDVCAAYAELGEPIKLEAQDIPHLCPENIATNEIKPSETWVALTWRKK